MNFIVSQGRSSRASNFFRIIFFFIIVSTVKICSWQTHPSSRHSLFCKLLILNFLNPNSSVADPGCLSRIRFFHLGSRIQGQKDSGSRIRIKEIKYFLTLKLFLSSRKNNLGCSSRTWIFPPSRIPDPGSRGQKSIESRIRINNTAQQAIQRILKVFVFLSFLVASLIGWNR